VSTAASDVVGGGSVVDVVEPGAVVVGTRVVATLDSASATRTASTAEATLAEATGAADTAVGASAGSDVDDEGENAANPITATRAMTRRPAYASGIRGLTYLRGSRWYVPPVGGIRMLVRRELMSPSARAHINVLGVRV
jgi:hypothetical protein